MKKIFNIIELILVISCILFLVLSYFFVKNSGVRVLIFYTLLSVFYFFGSAFHFQKDEKNQNSTVYIISLILLGLVLSITIMGILFKLNWWPGAATMLNCGLVGLVFLGLAYTFAYFREKSVTYLKILSRIAIYGAISIFFLAIPKMQIVAFKYHDYPDYIEAVKNVENDPSNLEYIQKEKEERAKIKF